jgi:hypothetical protein
MTQGDLPRDRLIHLRRGGMSPGELLNVRIADMAADAGRCPLCLSPLDERCGIDLGCCTRPLMAEAQAMALLGGYVRG